MKFFNIIEKYVPLNIQENLKNSLYFFTPSIIALLMNLYTMPIFSRNLSHKDFAIIGYFAAIQNMFLPILNLSLFPYYMRGFHTQTKEQNNKVISNIIIFLSFVNLITIGVGIIVVAIYFKLANVSFPLFPYIIISLFTVYFTIYISSITMNYKMQKKGFQFAMVSTIPVVLNICLGLLFVVGMHRGALGRMSGTLLAQCVVGVLAFSILFKKNISFDFEQIQDALRLGFPLIIAAMLDLPILYMDRILLEQKNDVINFGLYNIGLTFSSYIFLMGSAIFQAFEPDFYKYIDQKNFKKLISMLFAVFGTILVSSGLFIAFSKFIVSFLTSGRYTDAYHYANIFVVADFFNLISYLLAIYFIVRSKTAMLLYRKIIVAVIGTIFFSYAIIHWGFDGAAYTRIAINFINCILLGIFILIMVKRNPSESLNCSPRLDKMR